MLGAFVILLIVSFAVQAEPFDPAPEDSGLPWITDFPYQRNILWEFYDDPDTEVDETYLPHYEGYDDGKLYDSDWCEVTGDVEYFASVDLDGYQGIGLIGIINPPESGKRLTGEVTFHIDNWAREYPYVKHIWKELVFAEAEDGTSSDVLEYLYPPAEGEFVINGPLLANQDELDGLFRKNSYWYSIEPNPYMEEIVIRFEVNPGYYALVDSLHIATECIPEPATMMLLGSLATGLFGFAGLRRRIYK